MDTYRNPQNHTFSGEFLSHGGHILAGNSFDTGGGDIHFASPAADGDAGNRCLSAWRLTDPREDKVRILDNKDPLLEGSCTWILHDQAFTQWWNNDESRILWIHGDPGKGKTMIMMALIDEISRRLQLSPGSGVLSYFFCQNTIQDLSSAVAIVRGLTYLLATQNPGLTSYLRKKYDEAGSRLFDSVNALYGLWKTLSEITQDPSLPRVYLMVDALDECDSQSLETFLKLLSQSGLSSKVKWMVTSRNETKIIEHLQRSHLGHDMSLELNSSQVSEAVTSFINYKVNNLAARKNYGSGLQSSIKEYLTEHADGTFLWVALVCKELEKAPKWRTRDVYTKFPGGLEPLYQRMLEQILQNRDLEEVEVYLQTLRTITLSYRPLHLGEMGIVAGLPEDLSNDPQALQDLVGSCGSFLTLREQIVYFVHQSAKDYFSTGNGLNVFPSGQTKAHCLLADRLLRLMSDSLRRDVCGLRRPGILMQEVDNNIVGRHLPAHVQYACCYWVHHLKESGAFFKGNKQVHTFLQEHFLHWLEALGLIKKISDGAVMVRLLEEMLIKHNINSLLLAMIRDAKRFILRFGSIIEKAPLQTYGAALAFSPLKSEIRQQFWNHRHPQIERVLHAEETWNSARGTLEGHSSYVRSVAFSPDGQLVASGSYDETVRLWDAATGAARGTLEGHSDGVNSVAFSPDGQLVASGSDDRTVRLWDAATGAARGTLEGHSYGVRSVAFSPDGQLVASGSDDRTVRLWDAATGAARGTLEGHSDGVRSVAFSPDGQLVASGSDDGTVRLWDAATGAARGTLEGHSGYVNSVAFSPDGQLVASGSYDGTVRLWDAATGAARGTLEGHSGYVNSVAFSPDGQLVASGSDDGTVRLWDAATGAARGTLEGHSDGVNSVAFSPDGQLVASGSDDGTVRLWDAATGAARGTLEGHSDGVNSVAFSPDGQLIETDSGALDIHSLLSSVVSYPSNHLHTLFVASDWVVREEESILWLPPDYRKTCAAVRNGVLVLGHLSGRVSFFE